MADRSPVSRRQSSRRRHPGEEYLVERKGSAHWYYDFSIDGHRYRGSSGTTDQADAAKFAFDLREREWRRISLGEQPVKHLTLAEAFATYYEERSKGTRSGEIVQRHQMARMIRILGTRLRLADLDDATIADLLARLRAGEAATEGQETRSRIAAASVNRYLGTISVVCEWARDTRGAVVGPWNRKHHLLREPPPRETYLQHEQAAALMREVAGHARPIIYLDLLTGLRKANVTELTWEQIDLRFRALRVRQKGDRPLSLPITDKASALLEQIEPDAAKRSGPVFWYGNPTTSCLCSHCVSPLYRGAPIRDWRETFKTAAKAIGMPHLRPHDLRHTVASWLLDATGDIHLVRDQLGHSQLATTLRYAHRMPGRRAEGIDAATAALEVPASGTTKKKDGTDG
jgi:integrase